MVVGLDFGSNSLQMTSLDASGFKSRKYLIQTARGLKRSGQIGQIAIDKIYTALDELLLLGVDLPRARAVATAAFRQAKNANALVQDLYDKYGLRLKIISPKEEARLTQKALRYARNKLGFLEDFYFCDLGGASMELGINEYSISLNCGILSMYEQSIMGKYGLKKLLATNKNLQKNTKDFSNFSSCLQPSFGRLKQVLRPFLAKTRFLQNAPYLVLNSGTPCVLAAYKMGICKDEYEPFMINGSFLEASEMLSLGLELYHDKKIDSFLGANKKEYILVGAYILASLKKRAQVFDSGVCGGLCLDEKQASFKND